jgi:hypothetical protein
MPAATFGKYCPKYWTKRSFLEVKSKWFVSMQAALYRGRELGGLSDRAYRSGIIHLRGLREHINEPGEFDAPYPEMLTEALELVQEEVTLEELAEDAGLTSSELETILRVQQVPQKTIEKFKPVPAHAKILRFTPLARID